MKILTITYRTNRPTVGSRYIHEHVEMTASVGPKETPASVLAKLKAQAHALLYPELSDLRARLAKANPLAYARLSGWSNEALAADYAEHSDAFEALIRGDLATKAFLDQVLPH